MLDGYVISNYSTLKSEPISPDTEALLAAVSVPPTYIPCRLAEIPASNIDG